MNCESERTGPGLAQAVTAASRSEVAVDLGALGAGTNPAFWSVGTQTVSGTVQPGSYLRPSADPAGCVPSGGV